MRKGRPGAFEQPACCLCGSVRRIPLIEVRDYEVGFRGPFQVVRCAQCDLVYTSPRPTLEALLEHYYPDDYLCYKPMGNPLLHQLRMRIYNRPRHLALARSAPCARPRLLDVGCADGKFLRYLSDHTDWEAVGVEPNSEIANRGRQRGLNIIDATLEQARFSDNSFDIVTMSHVLEHVMDPLETLREVARILRPGGILDTEQPDLDAPERRLFGRCWWGWHMPRHLHHFSRESLTRMIEAAGLRLKGNFTAKVRPGGHAWSLQYLLQDLGLGRSAKLFSYNNPIMVAFFLPLELCLSLSGHTGFMQVIAEKP